METIGLIITLIGVMVITVRHIIFEVKMNRDSRQWENEMAIELYEGGAISKQSLDSILHS